MSLDSITGTEPQVEAQRWDDVRYIGELPGRYALSERRHSAEENIPVYACRLCSISTRMAVVIAPVIGEVGETIGAHFDAFGLLRAKVARQMRNGFAMEFDLPDYERMKLAGKIAWQKQALVRHLPDKREYKRILPRVPRTVLTLSNGEQMPCFVIDISRSGAAISAKTMPQPGMPVIIGQLVGQVVRYLDVGFAVQFTEIQDFGTARRTDDAGASYVEIVGLRKERRTTMDGGQPSPPPSLPPSRGRCRSGAFGTIELYPRSTPPP